ncbi:MAG TPA: zinc-dependent metalloprotease, partial [Candidatus Limnocylindrales bacterium]|nr:zinc-dependent metalloprotease [Candidatus Limnocylindrales bacterium]
MDEPGDHPSEPSGAPFGGAWDDVPLLREIERVLRSSSGPVNWELARQIGIASATQGGPDPEPTEEDHRLLDEGVRVAELRVADLTGLEPPHDVAVVTPVRRARWVQENLQGLRTLLEPSATKLGAAVAAAQQAAMPEEASAMAGQMLQQLAPLLTGAQVGSVLGYLGQHVLGQYDVAVPRPGGEAALLFVVPNLARFEGDWSLPPVEFRTFV